MTSSPSETESTTLSEYADEIASAVGGTGEVTFDTVKVTVDADDWEAIHVRARDELGLVFFSWLSAVDWSNEVAVGDAPGEEVEERFEILTTVSDLTEGKRVTFSTSISKDEPAITSLVGTYAGANWHEREAHEMFGIDFTGHPDLSHLYLPESFVGNPLRKDYPLLSREVKPWPGTVDVEPLPEGPSEENPEA